MIMLILLLLLGRRSASTVWVLAFSSHVELLVLELWGLSLCNHGNGNGTGTPKTAQFFLLVLEFVNLFECAK